VSPQQIRDQLIQFPRLAYLNEPSPLRPLPKLREAIKSGPELWIKRDDELGPGLGGNKGRKLAYLLAEAQQQGKEKVVTYGGLQSNHARMTAAACAKLGLAAHLYYFRRRPQQLEGNLLLNQLLGAKMHFIPFGESDKATMTLESTIRLVRLVSLFTTGPDAYFIPGGGHNVTGGLGYVEAAVEIQEQAQALELPLEKITLVSAAGTGGTLAGLMAGLALLESPMKVLGIDIGRLWKGFPASISRLANQLVAGLGGRAGFTPETVPLIENDYVGLGYAKSHPPAWAAIRMMAQNEGIILDPVYTGKALAGLLDLIRNGRFSDEEILIFLHTGGLPALWASPGFDQPLGKSRP
jgi:D-cysteine desulfhydrase family pyridoxal phosphate-dependent enzyme